MGWSGSSLVRSKKNTDCHTARFAHGAVTLDPDATPDVTISADIVDFVRLVTGQSNAALLYLGGLLRIEGEEMLALSVGTVFTRRAVTTPPSTRRRSTRSTSRQRSRPPRAST